MTWALAQKLKAPDKLVLLLLGYRTNPDTDVADATIDKLATECGMSRSGLKLAVQRLVDAGLVEVEERKVEGGKNLPNLYRLSFVDRGHDVTPVGPRRDRSRGHDVTAKAGSLSESSSTAGAKLDLSCWPPGASDSVLAEWLAHRKRKRAAVTELVITQTGAELHAAAAIGWTVDQALTESIVRNWQGLKAAWLEPKPGYEKPQPVRAGAGTAGTPHGRRDYAQGRGAGNAGGAGRQGGAIDRALANAAARTQGAVTGDGARPDRRDDDCRVRPPLDFDPR